MRFENQPAAESKPRKRFLKILAVLLVVIVLIFMVLNAPLIIALIEKLTGFQSAPTYSHDELVSYALSLINSDRVAYNAMNVTLSSVDSGQMHADGMLQYGYFSHWDTNGYKPYMRYTLAGGRGSVEENVAWQYNSGSIDAKEAIQSLEYNMMYNDAAENWGHRDNIVDKVHDKVSIGIAYDRNNLYLVQDFENSYISWSTLNIDQNAGVTMTGSFLTSQFTINSVNLYYDPLPANLTPAQLSQAPYNGSYNAGSFVGMALPSGYKSTQGITITVQTWTQTGTTFEIRFNVTAAFNVDNKGVYTLYLQPNPQTTTDSLTSYSYWHD